MIAGYLKTYAEKPPGSDSTISGSMKTRTQIANANTAKHIAVNCLRVIKYATYSQTLKLSQKI